MAFEHAHHKVIKMFEEMNMLNADLNTTQVHACKDASWPSINMEVLYHH